MAEREATITRAWALEFRPYQRLDGRPRGRCALVRVEASLSEPAGQPETLGPPGIPADDAPGEASPVIRPVIGFGEIADLPGSATDRDAGWSFADVVMRRLEGLPVPVAENGAADAWLTTTLGWLRQAVAAAAADCPEPQRDAVLAGVETALIDVVAKAAGTPFAAAFGHERRRAVQVSSGEPISVAAPRSDLRAAAEAQATFPMLRFRDVGDAAGAIRAMVLAADVAGTGKPVWLDLADGAVDDERKVISSVVDVVRARGDPIHVVVRVPADRDERVLAELQSYADSLVPPQGQPGIVLMAASRDRSAAALRALAGSGVRGLEIDPTRSGGLRAAADLIREVTRRFPAVRVGLNVPPASGRIAARAVVGLAETLTGLDYLSCVPAHLSDTVGIRPAMKIGDRGQLQAMAQPGLGVAGLPAAARRLNRCSSNVAEAVTHEDGAAANVYHERLIPGTHFMSHLMERAALGFGLDTLRSRRTVVCHHPMLAEPIGFASSMSGYAGRSSSWVLLYKDLTRKILKDAGVAVADGRSFAAGQVDEAVRFANSLAGSAVVKPRRGAGGVNVFTDLRTEDEVRRAIETIPADRDFIVEKFVTGELYRFLVVGNRVVSVVLCRPPTVVADGASTVLELVLARNALKLNNPHMSQGLIGMGPDTKKWLESQGLNADSVPAAGRVIRLRGVVNGAQGADTFEVMDETHPSMLELAVNATRAVPGLDHTGVDLIGDHRLSAERQDLAVLELNMPPGLGLHHYPMTGPARDVAADLVRRSCELAGFDPGQRRSSLDVRVRIKGKVRDVGYRAWFAQHAKSRGVSGAIGPAADGDLEAVLHGDSVNVSIVVSGAWAGPPEASVVGVEAHHLEPAGDVGSGFEVLT